MSLLNPDLMMMGNHGSNPEPRAAYANAFVLATEPRIIDIFAARVLARFDPRTRWERFRKKPTEFAFYRFPMSEEDIANLRTNCDQGEERKAAFEKIMADGGLFSAYTLRGPGFSPMVSYHAEKDAIHRVQMAVDEIAQHMARDEFPQQFGINRSMLPATYIGDKFQAWYDEGSHRDILEREFPNYCREMDVIVARRTAGEKAPMIAEPLGLAMRAGLELM